MSDGIGRLEQRVARLEVQLASLRRAVIGSRRPGSVVQAPFQVLDARGETVLSVEVGESGPFLWLRDRDASGAVVMEVDARGGKITLTNDGGERVATLVVDEAGGRLDLFDRDGRWAATAHAASEGGCIYALNGEGKQVAGLEATATGGQLYVQDRDGHPAASLVGATRAGRLHIHGDTGEQAATIFTTTEGGCVTVAGPDGAIAATLRSDAYGGTLGTIGKPDDPWIKWPCAVAGLGISAITCFLFTAASWLDPWLGILARVLCLWWGATGLGVALLITLSAGASWQRCPSGRYRISAVALVIGFWIGHGGAPWLTLPVLPLYGLLEQIAWRRLLPARGDARSIPLPAWLGYLCLGELFGFIAGLWVVNAFR